MNGDWQVENYFETYDVAAVNNGNLTGGYTDFYFFPDLENNGTVSPGTENNAIARFDFSDNFDSGSHLNLQILSNDGVFGGHDNIFVDQNLSVGCSLTVSEIGTVADGEFTILQCDGGAGCRTGVFSMVNLPVGYSILYTSEAVILTKGGSCNLNLSFTTSDATCFGNSNGSIFTTVAGGNAPFTYLWSNGKTTKNINLLAANDYTLTTTDAAGCTATGMATVGQLNSQFDSGGRRQTQRGNRRDGRHTAIQFEPHGAGWLAGLEPIFELERWDLPFQNPRREQLPEVKNLARACADGETERRWLGGF